MESTGGKLRSLLLDQSEILTGASGSIISIVYYQYQYHGHALWHTYYKDAELSCTISVRLTSQGRIFSSWAGSVFWLRTWCSVVCISVVCMSTPEWIWVMFWRGSRCVVSLNKGHIKDLALSRRQPISEVLSQLALMGHSLLRQQHADMNDWNEFWYIK